MHADEPGAEADEHEQRDLGEGDGHADRAGGLLAAADGEDPVAVLGAQQHPGGQGREDQPPHDRDLHLDAAHVEGRGEQGLGLVEAVHVADVVGGDVAGDELGDGEVDALQDQEGGQGHQEARQAGLHQHPAVEGADGERGDEGDDHAHPDVHGELVAEHAGGERGGDDGDTGGQVELAADHQQGDGQRHDADGGRLVQHGRHGAAVAERGGGDQEEDEHGDGAEEDADLGPGEQPQRHGAFPGPSVGLLGAGGRRRERRRLSLWGHAHHRVPFEANSATALTLDLSTKAGPVSTGCSPPPL